MTAEKSSFATFGAGLRDSPLLRLLAIGALVVALLIPIEWISALITERMQRRTEAVADVSSKWGRAQTITGPVLVVPYTHRWTEAGRDGQNVVKSERRRLTILPTQLRIEAKAASEERYRGIFAVPVYRVILDMNGDFEVPDLADLGIQPELIEWQRSAVALGITDARAIQSRAAIRWNDDELEFLPGPGAVDVPSGVHAQIATPFAAARASFAFRLELNGSSALTFTPAGQETHVILESNWPSPSFQGSWLPGERTVDAGGFRAAWQIPYLGRNQPAAWTSESTSSVLDLQSSAFGVDFAAPIDAHRMADRSVKYARLFVLLTFGTLWLIEVVAGMRVHPIQYLLIGCALCTFYLLELSLAEQLGFALAYSLAGSAVAAIIGLYGASVLRGRGRGAAVAATVGGLYAYLYVLLTIEDYALLLGSVGLFAAVTAIMLVTRRIDWYASGRGGAVQPDCA